MDLVAIVLGLIFLFSLISARLERTWITAPMAFTCAGMVAYRFFPEWHNREGLPEILLKVAEAGLVLLLFTDASRTPLVVLRKIGALPARLLGPGMLLTLLLGLLLAKWVLPSLTWWEAGILSAILAPTDAGLGQVIVTSERIPLRIRQALNVEAGLNDGLSVPFLLFFIALAGSPEMGERASLTRFIVEQLGYGFLIGLGIGLIGGGLLAWSLRHRWIASSFLPLAVVGLPLLCAIGCEAVGASMFIGAFVAGLAVTVFFPGAGKHSVEFAEEWGQGLNLAVFFIFGLIAARALPHFDARILVYAVLSLTVIRMLPVALALWGTGLHRVTVAFMGWFGPRGLASIVLGMVYLEQHSDHPGESTIRWTAIATVWLSILLHGLSAQPGLKAYAAWIARLDPQAPEKQEIQLP